MPLKCSKGSKGMAATDRIIPARISEKLANEVTRLAKETFVENRKGYSGITHKFELTKKFKAELRG